MDLSKKFRIGSQIAIQGPVSNILKVVEKRKYINFRTDGTTPLLPLPEEYETEKQATKLKKDVYEPNIEPEVPNTISFAARREVSITQSVHMSLPPLPAPVNQSFELILSSKLNLCMEMHDFSGHSTIEEIKSREEKTSTLRELLAYIETPAYIQRLNSKYQRAIFRMIETNLFRVNPVFPTRLMTHDYQIAVIEPSWPHLLECHKLLIAFISAFPKAEFVNLGIIKKAFYLLQLPDIKERLQFQNFLKTYAELHKEEIPTLINLANNMLIDYHEGLVIPYCVIPLLNLIQCLLHINGDVITKELVDIVDHAIIPLIGGHYLPLYIFMMQTLFISLVKISPIFYKKIFTGIERYWPKCSGTKEILCIELLIALIEPIKPDYFDRISDRVFLFLGRQVYSQHAKVVEAILNFWNIMENEDIIKLYGRSAIRAMYESVYEASKIHWSSGIREKCNITIDNMKRINAGLVGKLKTNIIKRKRAHIDRFKANEDSFTNWLVITKQGAQNGANVVVQTFMNDAKKQLCAPKNDPVFVSDFSHFMHHQKEFEEKTESEDNYLQLTHLTTSPAMRQISVNEMTKKKFSHSFVHIVAPTVLRPQSIIS